MKAQVVFAGVLFAGVLSSSPGALAQQVWRDPYQLPQVPMRPAIQLPMPDQRTPLQTPGAPFALRSIAYPMPTTQSDSWFRLSPSLLTACSSPMGFSTAGT
jgi:hypothetical protein